MIISVRMASLLYFHIKQYVINTFIVSLRYRLGAADALISRSSSFKLTILSCHKNKGVFVSGDALIKILYLAAMDISDKWPMPIKDWGKILDNLIIHLGERVKVRV